MFFVLSVCLLETVFAVSGVTPGSYDIDFEPGLTEQFFFEFTLDDGVEVDLSVAGGLANYFILDKKRLVRSEEVVVSMQLPDKIVTPGVNEIVVGGKAGGIDLGGLIRVNVPYPNEYAEVSLSVANANAGEDVGLSLEIFNEGRDAILAIPIVQIFKGKEMVDSIDLDSMALEAGSSDNIVTSFSTEGYLPGDYLAVVLVEYDDDFVRDEDFFTLGEFVVKVIDYTKEFYEDKINPFEIKIASLWGSVIEDFYVELRVVGVDDIASVTSDIDLTAWDRKTINGFLDMRKIEGDSFQVEMILYGDGEKISSEIFDLKIIKGFDYVFWLVVVLGIIVFSLISWRAFIFAKKFCCKDK